MSGVKVLPDRVRWRLGIGSRRYAAYRAYRRRRRRTLGAYALAALMLAGFASIALVVSLRWIEPPVTACMLHKRAAAGQADFEIRQRWVDFEAISPDVAIAVVAAEDQRFPLHSGFDFTSIEEVLRKGSSGGRMRGASTISQQVAKNLFLWPERSLLRKGLEAWFTLWIELAWPKQRILEMYLNVVEFGPGIFGVGAASEAFFGVVPAELGADQAALLASVLPNPARLHAQAPSPYVERRREWILWQMDLLGGAAYLTDPS
jgi:monofunctional biosynthetic peptidoglycan transglycosylase